MKESKNAKDRGEIGFKKPTDGWHIIEFQEGVGFLTDKDGNVSANDEGKKRYKFPAMVKDDQDESNGLSCDLIVLESEYGGTMVANALSSTKLLPKFDEKFPDNSVFDKEVIEVIKVKLPGKSMRVKTETSKDGKWSNWVKYGPLDATIAELDGDAKPKADKKDKKDGGTKAKKEDEGW